MSLVLAERLLKHQVVAQGLQGATAFRHIGADFLKPKQKKFGVNFLSQLAEALLYFF
jgi:hypothetical protein